MLLGSGIPATTAANPDESEADPVRVAFGLSDRPTGTPVENDYGMTLNLGELHRLQNADLVVARGKALAELLDKQPDEFAGAWFDRTRDTLVVQLVAPSQTTRSLVAQYEVGGPVEIREVQHSLATLQATQAEIEEQLDQPDFAKDLASVGIRVPENRVLVEVLSGGERAMRSSLARYGELVEVRIGERMDNMDCTGKADCHPPLKGGLDIWRAADGGHCSSGFVYQDASHSTGGLKGKILTTAGHCSLNPQAIGETWRHGIPAENIGAVYQNMSGSGTEADVMFIDIPNTWGSNDVFRVVSGAISIQNITTRDCASEISGSACELAGETVCYSGRSTGYRCGTLQSINITLLDPQGRSRLHNRTVTPNPSTGGDSGAAAFAGGTAKGHHWGGNSSVWAYSHIWYVQEYCSWSTSCRVQVVN